MARWQLVRLFDRRRLYSIAAAEVVVSLTSYPPRFPTLALTCKSLLLQKHEKFAVVLWVTNGDYKELPTEVLALQLYGLHILKCEDYRSYKKIIPIVELGYAGPLIIADDDVYYWRHWLSGLLEANAATPEHVCAYRVHRVKLQNGKPLPYSQWEWNIQEPGTHPLNFATGCGGVLYPKGFFESANLAYPEIEVNCPNGDDIWLYWATRLQHRKVRKITGPLEIYTWPGTQESALWHSNISSNKNDQNIKSMMQSYGFFT